MTLSRITATAVAFWGLAAAPAMAGPVFFSTGDPDGLVATVSRPDTSAFEIETADDFILTAPTKLTGASFTGLLAGSASSAVRVVAEIYAVFPVASDTTRTPVVPTRTNSPSDVELLSRDSADSTLTFSESLVSSGFAAANSVAPGGIHPEPSETTGGNGGITGDETRIDVTFTDPIVLPAGHYFFVPQVQTDTGDFYWLSAPKPIVGGTPFTPDLQSWTRDGSIEPDWLRVGSDIIGSGAFNASFSLTGVTVGEPASALMLGVAVVGLAGLRRRR